MPFLPRRKPRHCPACGYDLRGLRGRVCPECGQHLGDWRPRRPWLFVALFWVVQALLIHLIAVSWIGLAFSVEGPQGRPWGDLSDANIAEGLVEPGMLMLGFGAAAVITAAQAVFLFPVRRPAPAAKRGTSVYLSLAVAGLTIAMLVLGLLFAGAEAIRHIRGYGPMQSASSAFIGWFLLAAGLVSWAIATPLLIQYCRRTPRESMLARVAASIFAGTVIEAAATIPLDVMVRRRTDCYCDAGTFYTLTICAAVGLFALGPAVFLPLLAKRRRPYYAQRCTACAYDMSATARAERCPECGTPWTSAPSPSRIERSG